MSFECVSELYRKQYSSSASSAQEAALTSLAFISIDLPSNSTFLERLGVEQKLS